ncbi:LysM peptidoglycan-binding domain-containing protein [Nocardioides okcheonensis]|uniref:LysM peptidoglycan-binding domain-containing protein n=1 Tax=Nocardioides okcheonensis TaxID=2894081 RepID=UPI001E53CD8A|nr:LysM peptidoglycan-binding domain-containing protein [Nocardioides okcheonensis]UFN45205.1 LysM peptidoglycan-binding domain-containing protein [Nocardioides okcheonensis]
MPTPRAGGRLLGLLATLLLAGILVGLPAMLIAIGATPLPGASPSLKSLVDSLLAPDDGTLLLSTLELVAWAAWAYAAAGLLTELTARLRGVPSRRVPGLGTSQFIARTLIGVAALLFVAAPNVTGTAPAAASQTVFAPSDATKIVSLDVSPASAGSVVALSDPTTGTERPSHLTRAAHTDRTTSSPRAQAFDHTVKPGESLWSIAAQHLGEGSRFTEVVELNRDIIGDKPGFLRPGWVLSIPITSPTDAAAVSGVRHHVVRPGDTLTAIAADLLGDPSRYLEIFNASTGTIQHDGTRLTDPDLIRPGWRLTIPQSTSSGARAAAQDAQHHNGEHSDADAGGDLASESPADQDDPRNESTSSSGPIESPRPQDESTTDLDDSQTRTGRSDDSGSDRSGIDRDELVGEEDDSVLSSTWFVTGLAGGGMLLAGALLLALRTRRRSQFRTRRPGRTIASPDPALAPIEKSAAAATSAAVSVEFVDQALRRLAAHVAATRSSMPPLAAVELGHSTLTLHLSAPADLPAPWQGTVDRTHWHIDGVSLDTAAADETSETVDGLSSDGPEPEARDLDARDANARDLEAPYPLLVTIGTSDTGETWMLNCEELGALAISGDHDNARNLMRHLAAQIAVNPWSSRVTATCIGIAGEVASMDDRLTCLAGTEDLEALIHDALRTAEINVARASAHGTDVSTARTGYLDDDTWPARLLLVDAAPSDQPTRELLDQLVGLVAEHPGQAATAVVTSDASTDGGAPDSAITLNVTRAGRVTLDEAGLDLVTVGLTSEEADGCARLYAQRAELDDVSVPPEDPATDTDVDVETRIAAGVDADVDHWTTYADKAGALRKEYTRPRDADQDNDGPADVSILDGDDEHYLRAGALTEDDLQAVAPKVPSGLRTKVETADPHLDRDLADWFDEDCIRPRLSLLGPVTARTHGRALAKRKPYFTELLAFLALRRHHGATRDEVCDAFSISPGKCRDYINIVRDWLGTNPHTGEPHLPHADKSPAAQARGLNLYQVDHGLLVDADLFKRLSLRARARGGTDGQRDLATALRLVTGRPFDQLRPGGWTWLFEGERHDEYALVAVADVAFTLTTAYLAAGDLIRARAATEIAMLAAPDEEVTRLCLVRITEAEGDAAGAQQILREQVCNRTDGDDAPAELPERTETIIRNHQWLAS